MLGKLTFCEDAKGIPFRLPGTSTCCDWYSLFLVSFFELIRDVELLPLVLSVELLSELFGVEYAICVLAHNPSEVRKFTKGTGGLGCGREAIPMDALQAARNDRHSLMLLTSSDKVVRKA